MLDFQRMFPNEAACADYMERVRWPDGFVCPSCGTKDGTTSGVACGHFVEGDLRCAARLPGWTHLIVLTCDDDEPNANDGCEEVSP